ncbi:sensor domain-containing diguanylate cyclase [uncultured Cetobacterium sp.]|uniref:sensor domain-containing diguanylate cyclase n=1 Tax=uncultured Cetobacterium sp. TaxID=527638 RepID=UPI002630F9B5|nr:sensor domain-containing diguanylate cyclase [uncultured Cetobacterium sp.]
MRDIDFFEKISCGALICKNDKYSTILKANSAFYKMVGYTEDEMKKIHKNRFSELVVDDLTEILEKVNQAVGSEKKLDYEYRIKNKDNKIMWIHDVATYDEENNLFHVIIMDITYREDELNRVRKNLEKDLLSNLLNRAALEKKVKNKIDKKMFGIQSLIIIDLDNFKCINDNMGHQKGDEVISFIGTKLKEIFHKEGIVGRLGGDEFAVYLENITKSDLEVYLKRMIDELEITIEKIKIKSTIGVAYDKNGGCNFKELYKLADFALYALKKTSKGSYLIKEN